MLRALLILLGTLGVADTLAVSAYSNMNFGTILPFLLGAPLLLIGIFFHKITAFFSSTVLGAWIKGLLIAAYAGFLTIVAICSCLIYREGHAAPPAGADAAATPVENQPLAAAYLARTFAPPKPTKHPSITTMLRMTATACLPSAAGRARARTSRKQRPCAAISLPAALQKAALLWKANP